MGDGDHPAVPVAAGAADGPLIHRVSLTDVHDLEAGDMGPGSSKGLGTKNRMNECETGSESTRI